MKIWKQIESICLNLESSLATRLESASTKLGIAGSVDLLICFDSFQITERSPLIFLLVLGESRDYGKQLPNLISDWISLDLILNRFDLIWRFNWLKVTMKTRSGAAASSSQWSWKEHLAKSEESSSAELDKHLWRSYRPSFCAVGVASSEANSLRS